VTAAELVLAFLGGLAFGGFSTVAVYRLPRNYSVVAPRSSCPNCEQQLAWYDTIPVASWLVLRGRCRSCGHPIPVSYPLIELLTALVWLAVVARLGVHPELPVFLAFATALVVLSAIDIGHHRLPNNVLGPASIVAVVLMVPAAAVHGRWVNLEHAAIGAAVYGVPMLLIGLAAPSAMGGGDVKFAPYLGFHLGWFGWQVVVGGALFGLFLGGFGGALLLIVGRKGLKDAIPFGPFMALGAFGMLLVGPAFLRPWLG
jgi:leader peptidase (prepilin peptidase)/N-methyltransferase